MKKKIKNYTSEVPARLTVERIEHFLVNAGAQDIMKNYSTEKKLESISFRIFRHNKYFAFRLPANVNGVCHALWEQDYIGCSNTRQAQAERTAWKCVQDWVELQLTMIELQQADIVEVFFPFLIIADGKTLFKSLQEKGFSQLQLQ